MIKFGPSGCCELFLEQGHKSTIEEPKWLSELGLDCFEYSFGKGVRISQATANLIGEEFKKYNIEISVHAPYFINFATEDEIKANNNIRYLTDSINALINFGGKRVVFHPGSPMKLDRKVAFDILLKRVDNFLEVFYESELSKDIIICPETMGKLGQLGDLDEIIRICKLDKIFTPCIDFGHLNARENGLFFVKDDYKKVLDKLLDNLGEERVSNMHIHFSKIEYSAKGEVRHLTFADDKYGPPFEPLMEALFDYKLQPYIACESAGTQTMDALTMKKYYNKLA